MNNKLKQQHLEIIQEKIGDYYINRAEQTAESCAELTIENMKGFTIWLSENYHRAIFTEECEFYLKGMSAMGTYTIDKLINIYLETL